MNSTPPKPLVAIACGGTGGHLFPGLAVAGELQRRGCDVALLISPKEVDQQAVKAAAGVKVFTLPAVGLQDKNYLPFVASFGHSLFAAWKFFNRRRPAAVLAMGGFTSAPPIFAGKDLGAKTFLHESNTIPGKANRFLSRFVDAAFIGFPEAAARLKTKNTSVTGTPVRAQFSASRLAPHASRLALGLDPNLPVVLVVGGSQGARGLNNLVLSALPLLAEKNWQWLHLTGAADFEKVQAAYAQNGFHCASAGAGGGAAPSREQKAGDEASPPRAVVKPFLAEMDLALSAATACVSRAGASSLAEIAAMSLPAVLVPLPTAAENHQFFNAAAFAKNGAAKLLDQKNSPPEKVAAAILELVENEPIRSQIQSALAQWHAPNAAAEIAENILKAIGHEIPAGSNGASGGEWNQQAMA